MSALRRVTFGGMSRKRALLEHLLRAGDDGLSGAELARLVGHRFSARLGELRRAGHKIESDRVVVAGSSQFRYRLVPDPERPLRPSVYLPDEPPLSINSAWRRLSRLLREDTPGARAEIVDLVRRQPELISSRSVRHNLGAKKTARLDALAAAAEVVSAEADS